MTQLNFTIDFEKVKEELMQSSLNDVVKSTMILILNEYMEKERDLYMNGQAYERDGNRHDYRNGYYERDFTLNVGKIKLKVPRTRSGNFHTEVFELYSRSDQALVLSMAEMVVNGVSSRKVSSIMEQLCGETVSKTTVSEITKKLDPAVKEWASRPLNMYYYRYLYVDAMYIKVREHHKVVSKAVYIGLGVREDGKREIIGLQVAQAESEENWSTFFESMKARGFQSPKLVISDAHEGLRHAIQKKFIGTSWQRCTVHFKRNILDKLSKKDTNEAKGILRAMFDAPNLKMARQIKEEFISRYGENKKFDKSIKVLDEGFEDAVQYYVEPEEAHQHIKSTNVLERLNGEVRRREQVIRIFPNNQSAFRLIGAVLIDLESKMDLGKRKYIYFNEE